MACLAHRKVREGPTTPADPSIRRDLFLDDVNTGVITALPVTERLLRRVEQTTRGLPPSCYIRTFDALHLVTAADSGFVECGPTIGTCSPPRLISDWSDAQFDVAGVGTATQ